MFLYANTAPRWTLSSRGYIACLGYIQRWPKSHRPHPGHSNTIDYLRLLSAPTSSQSFFRSYCDANSHGHSTPPSVTVEKHQQHPAQRAIVARNDASSSQESRVGALDDPEIGCHDDIEQKNAHTKYSSEISNDDFMPFARSVSSAPHPRQLPEYFNKKAKSLRTYLHEEKDSEYIHLQFAYTNQFANKMLRDGGLPGLKSWINETWGVDEAFTVAQLLLSSVLTSPHQLLGMLQLLDEVESDFSVRSVCLVLAGRIHKDLLLMDAALSSDFDKEVNKLRASDKWPRDGLNSEEIGLFLWRSNPEQVQELASEFLQTYPKPSIRNLLHFAMFCSHNEMQPLALSFLTALPLEELQSPSQLTLKCCQVLLRHDVVESTSSGPNFKYLPRLLEKGLTPDNMLYSRIVETALESGYPGVAWDIFRHLQSTKVDITPWTYLVLLRHSFNDSDVARVEEIMSEIHKQEKLYRNLPLVMWSMNIVRRIFHREKNMTTDESLLHILVLYDRVFTREPLNKLGISYGVASQTSKIALAGSESSGTVSEPESRYLSYTIWAFILCHRTGKKVRPLWARIQQLVDMGDVTVVECMRHDTIYNAFMWLNLKEKATMADALDILQYMLAKQFCAPTDRTWSILICGFLRQRQRAQAQEIYRLMKQHNMSLSDIRQEYWSQKWTLEYFEENLDAILDEQMMPDGTELGEAEVIRPQPLEGENVYRDMVTDFVTDDADPTDFDVVEPKRWMRTSRAANATRP